MNPSRPVNLLLLTGCLLGVAFASWRAHAGAILTKEGEVQLGKVEEKDKQIVLANKYGTIPFDKERVTWFTTDKETDTLLKAARKAMDDDESAKVICKLLELSAEREPATKAEAQELLTRFQQGIARTIRGPMPEFTYQEPLEVITPKMDTRTGPSPFVGVTLHEEVVDFVGFINYNTSAVAGNQQFTFTIPQPVFEKRSISTSVIVYGTPVEVGGYTGGTSVRTGGFGFGL